VVLCAVNAVCSEFRLSDYTIKLSIDDSVKTADARVRKAVSILPRLHTNLVCGLCTRTPFACNQA
jgi:hypothetical protein